MTQFKTKDNAMVEAVARLRGTLEIAEQSGPRQLVICSQDDIRAAIEAMRLNTHVIEEVTEAMRDAAYAVVPLLNHVVAPHELARAYSAMRLAALAQLQREQGVDAETCSHPTDQACVGLGASRLDQGERELLLRLRANEPYANWSVGAADLIERLAAR